MKSLNIKPNANTQSLILKTMTLAGITSTEDFLPTTSVEKAKQIIECEQIFKLSKHDAMLLVDTLDQPAKVHSKLQTAAKGYHTKKQ